MSYAQCPVCALRFRYQSELEAHAHAEHFEAPEVKLPPHHEHPHREEPQEPTSRLLRLP